MVGSEEEMALRRPLSKIPFRLLKPVVLLSVFALAASVMAHAIYPPQDAILIDNFSNSIFSGDAPEGWKKLTFPRKNRHTRYTIELEEGNRCLKAESRQSASAIYKEMRADLRQYQVLSWNWKIEGTLKDGDARHKEGDDFPARIYVAFEFQPEKATALEKLKYKLLHSVYGVEPPGNAITYIWANKLKKNEAIRNAFSENVIMVAVESGDEKAGSWVREERNIYEDYIRLFKEEPPPLRGFIVMTDSDNTGGGAVAWYDDLMLKRNEERG